MAHLLKIRPLLIISLIAVTGSYGGRENRADIFRPPPPPGFRHSPLEPLGSLLRPRFDLPAEVLRRLDIVPNSIRNQNVDTTLKPTNTTSQDQRIYFRDETEKPKENKPTMNYVTDKLKDFTKTSKEVNDHTIIYKNEPIINNDTEKLKDLMIITKEVNKHKIVNKNEPTMNNVTEKIKDLTEEWNEDNLVNNEIDGMISTADSTTDFTTTEDYESTTLDDLTNRALPGAVVASLLG